MMPFLAGWMALAFGVLNLILPKGTRGHRALGLLFILSMCLAVMEVAGRFDAGDAASDLFLGLTGVSCGLAVWAVLPFLQRRPGWIERHARRMQAACIGLVAAAGNEVLFVTMRHGPGTHPPLLLAVAVTVVLVAAGLWLGRRQGAEIRRVAAEWR